MTKEDIQNKSNRVHNSEYLIVGEYKNAKTKILIRHLLCNTEFLQNPSNHCNIGHGCPKCAVSKKRNSKLELQTKSDIKFSSSYIILSDNYRNNQSNIDILHKECNTKFNTSIKSHFKSIKGGCHKCYKNNLKTMSKFQSESDIIHNNEYTISNYINHSAKSIIKHKSCGFEFEQTPRHHLRGHGCPICNVNSKPEKDIKIFLDKNKINYLYQHRFNDCKYKNKLIFDFYLQDYNTCIEYDGRQHYEPVSYFGGQNGFNIRKKCDIIKTEYCINNGIDLIRIPYTEKITNELLAKLLLK